MSITTHLVRAAIVATIVAAGASGADAQTVNSYCIAGGGGLMARCGFATFDQCRNASTPYGICVASERLPDATWTAQARMNAGAVAKKPKR